MRHIMRLTSFDMDSDDSDSEGWLCEDLHLNLDTNADLSGWLMRLN